ncbi:hypothetical protein [Compostimonas suwonensis]|uniref:Uncharacterized protein n=1 Tax=Compostimonas suwonensis TaxID=1048394 RepID=A0A2M9C0J0_9MICO|nr:hypothetical protein [Compostimonas suwonensis]PJJ63868.1 hypothetical protein CLV54_1547 [Compostimonas suwonensis]
MVGRSVEELSAEFTDPEWREKFAEFSDLMELLGDCIISDSYVVPDEVNAAIKLTESGHAVLDRLTRKDKVNAKDARLMCALTLGHVELFVDIDATDLDRLVAVLHKELLGREIQFPFVWGRDLYDLYASTYEQEKDVLTNEETLKLLRDLPPGVAQYGPFTIGPFGLRRSLSNRGIHGRRRVAAYHCAVPSCHAIHPVMLQTGQGAAINRDREKLGDYLQQDANDPSDWWAFADSLSGSADARYGDQQVGVLLPLIGDVLSDRELRSLVVEVLETKSGQLRDAVSEFAAVKSASEFVDQRSRAELLQLCLIANERAVQVALDKLVRKGTIVVPRGDVRRPVINHQIRSGAFHLRAELGIHGTRFVSDDPGLAILRERRLLNKLYLRDEASDVQELEWQLRGVDVEDLDEKLERYFRTKTPQESLERLVLARKINVVTACHEVGIDDADGLKDEQLIEAILWKLGFPIDVDEDPHASFWLRHQQLSALAQSSTMGNSERFLEIANPYFTGLEGILLDSLAYTAWALMSDHTRSLRPFSYDDGTDREAGLVLLQSIADQEGGDSTFTPDFVSEKVELRNLVESFRRLAKHLESCRSETEKYTRPRPEFPDYDGKTSLKSFVLRSTLPFIDLSRPSQDRIIAGLHSISEVMVAADVFSVRNDYAHYRRNAPDIAKVESALEAIGRSITRLEHLGFCRIVFVPAAVKSDRWGHARHEFIGPRSYEHVFSRPTTLDWMGLPGLDEPQYLMRAASFDDPNEVLRFTRRHNSDFSSDWSDFPKRRRSGPGVKSADGSPSYKEDVEVSAE